MDIEGQCTIKVEKWDSIRNIVSLMLLVVAIIATIVSIWMLYESELFLNELSSLANEIENMESYD